MRRVLTAALLAAALSGCGGTSDQLTADRDNDFGSPGGPTQGLIGPVPATGAPLA